MFLYDLGIKLYSFGIRLASFWNPKAAARFQGQNQSLPEISNRDSKKCIWIHCASLGEFEQTRYLIDIISEKEDAFIALSFFSPSGYEIRKDYEKADVVFYLPLDRKDKADELLDWLKPDVAIFVKYELWFNHLECLVNRGIPIYFIAAVFRSDQYFFHSLFGELLSIMKKVDHFIVQDNDSKRVLANNGISQVTCLGDPRIDSVRSLKNILKDLPSMKECPFDKVVVYGSIYLDDLPIILPFIESHPEYLHVLVPHDVSERNISQICKLLPLYEIFDENQSVNSPIQVIDKIGILTGFYPFSDLVYIGGGMGKGIHNILEPAVFSNPVIFGPNYRKFKEAKDLISKGSAKTIASAKEFESAAEEFMSRDRREIEEINKMYFDTHMGASLKSYELIFEKGDS